MPNKTERDMGNDGKPSAWASIPWKEILGTLATIAVGYFGYLGVRSQIDIPIHATETAEAKVTPPTATLPIAASSTPVSPTSTAFVTTTPVPTVSPTPLPTVSPTPSNIGLSDNCIDAKYWSPLKSAGTSYTKDSNGCWQLLRIGFNANNDVLELSVENSRTLQLRGIYRPIPENVDIEFKVTIRNFSSGENNPNILGLLGIGISGINVNSPEKSIIYYRALNANQPLSVLLGSWSVGNWTSLGIDFVSGITQRVKFSVRGPALQIFLDDGSIAGPFDISAMGPDKGLYIIYSLPSTNKLTASLSEFKIDEK
jgi:hypothetical protein